MVSLDQEIKKQREQQSQRFKDKKISRGRDSTLKGKNRNHPSDKRRPIHKNDRLKPNNHIHRNDNNGGRKNFNDDRQVKHPKHFNKQDKKRIVRAPRKHSQSEQKQQKGRTLKVMGLHPDFTNEDLYKLFSTQGALQKCLIEQDNFGRSQTTAIVKYHNASSAVTAIANLNQHKVMNSILTVQPYKNKRR